jgi:threonine synthase
MMRFRSTNKASKIVTFKEALLIGQAPDYGLYMPTEILKFSREELASFAKKKYHEIAFDVARKYVGDEISEKERE